MIIPFWLLAPPIIFFLACCFAFWLDEKKLLTATKIAGTMSL